MNKYRSMMRYSVLVLLCLASGLRASAQHTAARSDTTLKGATIEVLQSYKPQVKQAPKPEWVPQLPPADTSHPVLSFDVPQQTLYYTYSSLPLRPLALGRESATTSLADYVKLGGGNLSTIYLDAGIGSIKGKNYETAFHLHHLSQKGDIQYQQSSLSGMEADAHFHTSTGIWHTSLDLERNQYYYYGYDHSLYTYSADNVRQTYTTVRAGVDWANKADSVDLLTWHPAINVSDYIARFNTSEYTLGFDLPVVYRIDDNISARVALLGAITQYNTATVNTPNNYVELLPGIDYHGTISGNASFGLASGKGGSFYFLPDIRGVYLIPGTDFKVSAGWQSSLVQNTYEQLTTENPYMMSAYSVSQMRRDEIYAGAQTGVGNHWLFSGRVSGWGFKNLAEFITAPSAPNQFAVVYDNVNAVSLQLGASYRLASICTAGITGDFYHYFNGSFPHVWQLPTSRIKGDVVLMPAKGLSLNAYLAVLGGITAANTYGNPVKLDPSVDLGIGGEYNIVSRLSVFVQVDNILNDRYQRWYGYKSYGLNIYGGIRFRF